MRAFVRLTLTIMPIIVLAMRVQSHTLAAPHVMTKELARWLSVVNFASARKGVLPSGKTLPTSAFSGDRPLP
jgi:hypothetical protein